MQARALCIRNRDDGVVELSPALTPIAQGDRWLIIFTVAIAAAGLFMSGHLPGLVFLSVFAWAVAGEIVLGAKALLLLLLRPAAPIVEVSRFEHRRRAG